MHGDNLDITPLDEQTARTHMAALFRLTAREGLHEGISNHFSYALSEDGQRFLMNPYGVHFSAIKASDMIELDTANPPDLADPKIDIIAWSIHGAIHKAVPSARCLVHLHSQFATALLCLKNPDLPPIDQTSARFFNRLSWGVGFDGMGIGSEGERLAACLGNHNVLMMGAHGFLVAAQTPALAWDIAYHLERAAKNYITALSTGREVNILPGHIAEKTAQQWEAYTRDTNGYQMHLDAMMDVLDASDDSYRH